MSKPILKVENLNIVFKEQNDSPVVSDFSFFLEKGETVAIVGESGSGKTLSSLALLGLTPFINARITKGKILFSSPDMPLMNLCSINEKDFNKIRGNKISMIFQEPQSSLNPSLTIKNQMIEAIRIHQNISFSDALKKSLYLLNLTGIKNPEEKIEAWPHQLSGGQKQRVLIAMSIANDPDILIADEPTTALDVTMQSQIMDLLISIQKKMGMSIILITHDMRVVQDTADRVYVMYNGKIIETSNSENLFKNPSHPYTKALLKAIPSIEKRGALISIPGTPPKAGEIIKGCAFAPRCLSAHKKCFLGAPDEYVLNRSPYTSVRCFLYENKSIQSEATNEH